MAFQPVKFYQTGTFTVGNRLMAPEERAVQANMRRTNSLNSGHRACQGCGEALGARYAVDAAMQAADAAGALAQPGAQQEAVAVGEVAGQTVTGDQQRWGMARVGPRQLPDALTGPGEAGEDQGRHAHVGQRLDRLVEAVAEAMGDGSFRCRTTGPKRE